MATELVKMKRKRTAKKNIVLNNILPSCETVLLKEPNGEVMEEATVLKLALEEASMAVKQLDEMVSDLIEDDMELEQNENNSYEFTLKAKKMDCKLASFLSKQNGQSIKKENYNHL